MISICRRHLLPDGSTTCRPRSLEPEGRLESVEGNMAELEIDREDVHDRNKWRMNAIKELPSVPFFPGQYPVPSARKITIFKTMFNLIFITMCHV